MPPWSSRLFHPNIAQNPSSSTTFNHEAPDGDPRRDVRHGSFPSDGSSNYATSAYNQGSMAGSSTVAPNPPRGRPHARSISHPFPSLFGSGRKKGSGSLDAGLGHSSDDEGPARQSGSHTHPTPPRRDSGGKNLDDRDAETGNCMTCDAKVKWPKGLKVFRCGGCLTINDLEPLQRKPRNLAPPVGKLGENEGTLPSTIACDRTKAIIDGCIATYLRNWMNRPVHPVSQAKEDGALDTLGEPSKGSQGKHERMESIDLELHSPAASPSPMHVSAGEHRQHSRDGSDYFTTNSWDTPASTERKETSNVTPKLSASIVSQIPVRPTREPPPPPVSTQLGQGDVFRTSTADPGALKNIPDINPCEVYASTGRSEEKSPRHNSKLIFRPLEDYIAFSFGNYDCLNGSFFSGRPPFAGRTRSEGSAVTNIADHDRENHGGLLSDLDAKTLLIGDFAENGSWWSGRVERHRSSRFPGDRERQSTQVGRLVNHKSPRINWTDVHRWYDLVLKAGYSWKENLGLLVDTIDSDKDLDSICARNVSAIEEELKEARIHVHRVLLKVTENLLKRPGRLLKEPDDIRFLLILLANPILHDSMRSTETDSDLRNSLKATSPLWSPQNLQLGSESVYNSHLPRDQNTHELGHHSGIIKRIFGLLANLPVECHRCLVAWFSRLPEDQFSELVDLVGSFVTYRLLRQNGKKRSQSVNPTGGLIPDLSGTNADTSAQLHAALGFSRSKSRRDDSHLQSIAYGDDWQIKAAAKVMALLFSANNAHYSRRFDHVNVPSSDGGLPSAGLAAPQRAITHGQLLPTSNFYNSLLDYMDLVPDFEAWQSRRSRFSFCQYPFFLSIGAKIKILEYDARKQMEMKAREAFFDSILRNHPTAEPNFVLRVRRDCLVEDSLRRVSQVVGAGREDIKKSLKVQFIGEEGIDAGGLRKEWFLLLVRDIFDPNHGMFVYDADSQFCYFNPNSFETSDQYFLVGALLGLAIHNSTILDVALPPFAFKKLLASAPTQSLAQSSIMRMPLSLTLDDLAEFRPALARGLRQLLEFEGDVEATFCRDFVADLEVYGSVTQVPLCPDGEKRPVTNENRQEFVDLYVRYLLDAAVSRQFEPFKRGFFTVCGGNALSLFRPEEIELLIRGSDEPLDVMSVRAVAVYENWTEDGKKIARPGETVPVIRWFWDLFETANPRDQRKILSFITGSDRIPALGATRLVIKISRLGDDCDRFPVARTCFNMLQLYNYKTKQKLVEKLWRAVVESEGFGLK